MKIKKTLRTLTALMVTASMMSLTACGGGGGNTSVGGSTGGGVYYTHTELAYEFVDAVNAYAAGYDIELQKITTESYDYIVVYDYEYDSYDAYYLGGYNPGENINEYLYNNDHLFYYDLDWLGGNRWQDYYSGRTFQKTEATSKDLALMKALKEEVTVKKMTEAVQLQFGLSEARSRVWAEAAYKIDSAPEGSLTDEQLDNMTVELVGTSISDMQKAAKSGDIATISEQLERAGELNDGMSPDEVSSKLGTVFGL